MLYGLTFSKYCLFFSLFLIVTIFCKKNTNKGRTRLFIILVFVGLAFSISECVSVMLFRNTNFNADIFEITWKIRTLFILIFFEFFLIYHKTLVSDYKFKTIRECLFAEKFNMLIFVIFTIIFIIYVFLGNVQVPPNGRFYFITGSFGFVMLIVAFAIGGYAFVYALIKNKNNKKVIISFAIILVLVVVSFTFQLLFKYISFLPFVCTFIVYVIYFNIENPDIEILEEVAELKDKIDKSSNTKTDFLFNLSYDLINPINAIVSLSQSLKTLSPDMSEEIERDVKSIKYAGNTLLDSIDNLLDLSETDDEDTIKLREYSVYELLKRMEAVTITRIGAKQIKFEMDIDDNICSKLLGDVNKIQKILLNILSNATKYSDIGKIKMSVSCINDKDIQVLRFKISDTGIGIKDEDKSSIFDDSQETSGVGLALSKKYVESMNGTIRFESVYGAGTTFYIDIPQKIVGNQKISDDKKDEQETSKVDIIDCSKYKAVIVDDDILDIKVTKRLLEKYKFQINTFTKTTEFIDVIKNENKFDIVFLDHKMPEIDGIETMKVLRGLEGYEIPKLVVLTANAVAGARETYLKEGFDEYISKPIDINELDRVIKKVLVVDKNK